MIKVTSNFSLVSNNIIKKLTILKDREYLLRPLAVELIPQMTKRIHTDGKASDESQIGTYSPEYMKVRTGNFSNADRISRGPNTGKNKNAGTFSARSARAGVARPQYHRSSDTKIIVSLTRQLENDWSVIATQNGYGIGFLNSFNGQKLGWVEDMKNKKIGRLSKPELDYAINRINELIRNALNS